MALEAFNSRASSVREQFVVYQQALATLAASRQSAHERANAIGVRDYFLRNAGKHVAVLLEAQADLADALRDVIAAAHADTGPHLRHSRRLELALERGRQVLEQHGRQQ